MLILVSCFSPQVKPGDVIGTHSKNGTWNGIAYELIDGTADTEGFTAHTISDLKLGRAGKVVKNNSPRGRRQAIQAHVVANEMLSGRYSAM